MWGLLILLGMCVIAGYFGAKVKSIGFGILTTLALAIAQIYLLVGIVLLIEGRDSEGAIFVFFHTSAFVVLFIFSRMIGKQLLWKTLMGENYLRIVKTFVEEGTELFGYSILVIAAMEFYRESKKGHNPAIRD